MIHGWTLHGWSIADLFQLCPRQQGMAIARKRGMRISIEHFKGRPAAFEHVWTSKAVALANRPVSKMNGMS